MDVPLLDMKGCFCKENARNILAVSLIIQTIFIIFTMSYFTFDKMNQKERQFTFEILYNQSIIQFQSMCLSNRTNFLQIRWKFEIQGRILSKAFCNNQIMPMEVHYIIVECHIYSEDNSLFLSIRFWSILSWKWARNLNITLSISWTNFFPSL